MPDWESGQQQARVTQQNLETWKDMCRDSVLVHARSRARPLISSTRLMLREATGAPHLQIHTTLLDMQVICFQKREKQRTRTDFSLTGKTIRRRRYLKKIRKEPEGNARDRQKLPSMRLGTGSHVRCDEVKR